MKRLKYGIVALAMIVLLTGCSEEDVADHSAEYIGQWGDMYSQRCYMKIRCTDGINYYIDINWGSSAWENTHWSFTGTYDSSKKGILYSGSCIQEYYKEDGSVTEEYTYQDGEGLIFFGEDGMLHWDDWKENMGVDCRFEKTGDLTAEYILPESDSRYLTKADLTGLTAKQCRIARNEIYARHGRKFNDIGLQSYFDSCNWYFPSIEPEDFKDSMLNEYEMANKDLILEYEEELGN